jgi:hypothetical protein
VHREFRLHPAAGTTAVRRHVGRVLRNPLSRDRLGRARDAVVLPLDEWRLRRRAAAEVGG